MKHRCGRWLAATLALAVILALAIGAPGTTARASTPRCTPGPNLNCAAFPLDFVATNDCTGELVAITGVYHVVVQTTVDPGGTITTLAYTNYQDSQGVSVSGTKYQANLTDHQYSRTDPLSAETDLAIDDNYELISNAPTPNMLVRVRLQVHLDAFGFPTITLGGVDARCAG